MKEFFTLYNIIRLLLLIAGITFLLLYAFVKVKGERYNLFLILGLCSGAIANLMIVFKT